MLTSTDVATARYFSFAMRDAVSVEHVDALVDRLIETLRTYEQTGQFLTDGLSANQVAHLSLPSANGLGYSRTAVEHLLITAQHTLRAHEDTLTAGSVLPAPLTRINRVKKLAPHVSLAQARAGLYA